MVTTATGSGSCCQEYPEVPNGAGGHPGDSFPLQASTHGCCTERATVARVGLQCRAQQDLWDHKVGTLLLWVPPN